MTVGNWIGEVISNWYRPKMLGGVYFYSLNDSTTWSDLQLLDAYDLIPEVGAVIDMKAKAFKSGVFRVLDAKGNDVSKGDPLIQLLKQPNWFQAEKEFLQQTKVFRELFGNEYIYNLTGVGTRKISGVKAMYTLPPNWVDVDYDEKGVPFYLEADKPDSVKYTISQPSGQRGDLDPEGDSLIHLNDNRVGIRLENRKKMLKGEPKLKSLKVVVNNLKMAYETRGIILKRRGALGILSNAGADVTGQLPMKGNARKRLQEQYRQYGGLEGQDNVIITNANLKWQQMTVAPDKLGLFDETEEDFCRLCDKFGVPYELFASPRGNVKYQNKAEAEKFMYTNTTIPESNEWCGGLSKYHYPDGSRILVQDFSHLAAFQEDIEMNASALASLVTALSKALDDEVISKQEYKIEMNKLGIAVGTNQD